ncbi:MAG: sulfite exporter TauE/SafE family protein [Anaerolineae bacterium]|nr:sulfite exporter TauE/SafE family protein [Candidatus Roseilinea sp.]MDW8450249.1 sulfite exporter TauE/SafE family protein [Anaerolineae bacterium]
MTSSPIATAHARHSRLAFLTAIPIAALGGLLGLGGAEFRLPVLAGPLRYAAKQAVPLNLAISLITLLTALAIRSRTLSLQAVTPYSGPIAAMIGGAMVAAFVGATLAGRLSKRQFERVILVLLVAIGSALIVEGFLSEGIPMLIPDVTLARSIAGLLFGLGIGLVSSLLGVAGGELIIPTFMFAFGADIKTAGTCSLLIGIPTVIVGLVRYAHCGAFADRTPLARTVAPMGIGSVIGALIGGALAGIAPAAALKIGLGVILIVSAVRVFNHGAQAERD